MYAVTEVQHVIAVPTCSTDTLLVSLLGGAIAMAPRVIFKSKTFVGYKSKRERETE